MIHQPYHQKFQNRFQKSQLKAIQKNLYQYIDVLARQIGERNSFVYSALQQASTFIVKTMQKYPPFKVYSMPYAHKKKEYSIIVAEKCGHHFPDEIIVVGAHYDTVQGSPGADDNASGIAALLELVRLCREYENERTFRFVAFPLEEPPFYNTPWMGSYVYAKSCKDNHEKLIGMVALEMLAYFSDTKGTQKFPVAELANKFDDRGNFISIIGNVNSKSLVDIFFRAIRDDGCIPVGELITYDYIPGANLSDHAPFWDFGYKAIMLTDTAFYRNPNYHLAEDTIDTLNFKSFSFVVRSLFHSIKKFDQSGDH